MNTRTISVHPDPSELALDCEDLTPQDSDRPRRQRLQPLEGTHIKEGVGNRQDDVVPPPIEFLSRKESSVFDMKLPEFEEEDLADAVWTVKVPLLLCWDESDDGVPPFCRGPPPVACWKVFNPNNRYTNDNLFMIMLGNVGFSYFDKNRKSWMGAAMWSTLISMFFTVAGCFALSANINIVKDTNWVFVETKNQATGQHFRSYLGLRSLVYESEPCDVLGCTEVSFEYKNDVDDPEGSSDDIEWPNEFLEHALAECRAMTFSTAFGAFVTCVTLVFALVGTINRMRFSSDANIQKALGMTTDLCGFISLASTLANVGSECYGSIPREFVASDGTTYHSSVWMGPGYQCYLVCLFGAFMRALFHWLTPLPKRGSGCTPRLPSSLVKQLDLDGDGKVTWKEMHTGYHAMVQNRMQDVTNVASAASFRMKSLSFSRGSPGKPTSHRDLAEIDPEAAHSRTPAGNFAVTTQPSGATKRFPEESSSRSSDGKAAWQSS